MMRVLAFSGTPIKGGVIEKGLEMVLDGIGAESSEIVRLSAIDMKICTACKKCASANRCVIKDDVNSQLERIEKCDGYLLSGYPSFGSINALTKVFIERNWPLRHNHNLTRDKVGGAVVAGNGYLEEMDQYFQGYFRGYLLMDFKGTLTLRGNPPCMTCGYGEDCEHSGFLRQFGPGAKVTEDKFYDPHKDPDAKARALALGQRIGEALRVKKAASL
jgi:multimeric flavodoxin WrbA